LIGLSDVDILITSSPVPTETILITRSYSKSKGFSMTTISPTGLLWPTISFIKVLDYVFQILIFASLPPEITLHIETN